MAQEGFFGCQKQFWEDLWRWGSQEWVQPSMKQGWASSRLGLDESLGVQLPRYLNFNKDECGI